MYVYLFYRPKWLLRLLGCLVWLIVKWWGAEWKRRVISSQLALSYGIHVSLGLLSAFGLFPIFHFSSLFSFCRAGEGIQGLTHLGKCSTSEQWLQLFFYLEELAVWVAAFLKNCSQFRSGSFVYMSDTCLKMGRTLSASGDPSLNLSNFPLC